MKLLLVFGVYAVIIAILVLGILLAVIKGSLWLFFASGLLYVILFAIYGCFPSEGH